MEKRTESINETKKDSLVKKVLLAGGKTANAMKLSYVLGAGFGATGRFTGEDRLPAIPLFVDLFYGVIPTTPERIACYAAYGAGVATAYADKIYLSTTNIVNNL